MTTTLTFVLPSGSFERIESSRVLWPTGARVKSTVTTTNREPPGGMRNGGAGVHAIQSAEVTLLIALTIRSACPSLKIMKPGPGSTPAGAIPAKGGGGGAGSTSGP